MIHTQLFIDGQWRDAAKRQTRQILNPCDETVIALAADGDRRDAQDAIAAARAASTPAPGVAALRASAAACCWTSPSCWNATAKTWPRWKP